MTHCSLPVTTAMQRSQPWKRGKAVDSGVRSAEVAAWLAEKRALTDVLDVFHTFTSMACETTPRAQKRPIDEIRSQWLLVTENDAENMLPLEPVYQQLLSKPTTPAALPENDINRLITRETCNERHRLKSWMKIVLEGGFTGQVNRISVCRSFAESGHIKKSQTKANVESWTEHSKENLQLVFVEKVAD